MQSVSPITPVPNSRILSLVESRTGQKVSSCYQCGKCTAGCPVVQEMDISPRRVMRGLQLGLSDEILNSSTIWLCLACQTCSVRCPRQIDIARVMEELRLLALEEKRKPAQKEVAIFHRIFINQISSFGRVHELGLGGLYNLYSGHFLANIRMLPLMLAKGKLRLIPSMKGRAQARRITREVKKIEGESS